MLHGKYQWQFVAQSGNGRKRDSDCKTRNVNKWPSIIFIPMCTSIESDTAIIISNLNSLEMMREAERWSVCVSLCESTSAEMVSRKNREKKTEMYICSIDRVAVGRFSYSDPFRFHTIWNRIHHIPFISKLNPWINLRFPWQQNANYMDSWACQYAEAIRMSFYEWRHVCGHFSAICRGRKISEHISGIFCWFREIR